jgi:hypothetical protein
MALKYPGSETVQINTQTPPGSQPLVRPEAVIKVDELSYLIWDVADLNNQREFLSNFGMLATECTSASLLMRTYGDKPYVYVGRKSKQHKFVGMGFSALSRDDLVTLAKATNSKVEKLDRIGGGEAVKLVDPNGIYVEVSFGIEKVDPTPTRQTLMPVNTPTQKVRINRDQRTPLEPSATMKLGHCVTAANNMQDVCQWYMRYLGLIPTDVLCIGDGTPAVAFMRLDRGDKPADHHTVVVGKGGGKGYLHSAYEVLDLDSIAQGQQILKSKKYKHVWGIGRHILGSQLFDYWKDPAGFEFEHYADGDVYTADRETAYHPLTPGNVYAWGPDIPPDMLKPPPKQILHFLGGLFDGSVTLKYVKGALKAISGSARPWM